jgi:type III pantothenate kinase
MTPSLVLVSVGNTRTRVAGVRERALEPSQVLPNADVPALAAAACAHADRASGAEPTAVIASVNDPVAGALEAALRAAGARPLRFGRDLAVPLPNSLADDSTVGQDRLLGALGAFARSKQACVVIDAGTAVTVDFIDGEGTFHGGAIAPGLRMMLRALHEGTAALPLVELSRDLLPAEAPREGAEAADETGKPAPFGKDTRRAIALGVVSAVRGMAHELIDRYAEFYEAYPRIVATGGDAPLLFEHDPLIEAIVPDLTLIGMLEAVTRLDELADDEHDA